MEHMKTKITSKIVLNNTLSGGSFHILEAKQKYRGMFETQKSGNKTSSGEIGLNIRTFVSSKLGQDNVSGGVSVLCWHVALVANVLWKTLAER